MTKSGQSELAEPIAIRPTSETGEYSRNLELNCFIWQHNRLEM